MVTNGERQIANGISLYIHIPFCQTKCPYCDFNTYQGIEPLIEPYLEALALEIKLWGRTLERPVVNTIFFGGGTPSYIPTRQVRRVLEAVGDAFRIAADVETTVEANPGDLNSPALAEFLEMGVNRLSIGVQSLDDDLLSLLGRRHSAIEAEKAYQLAKSAGFQKVNLDLMYGLPYQTMDQWQSTLDRVLDLAPPHLSIYCLTLEKGTPLARRVWEGELPEPDPDLAADMFDLARERLRKAGYHHYEISNWSSPGQQCLHNMAYWLNQPYLGVGAGAHSHLSGRRFWTLKSPGQYVRSVHSWASEYSAPDQMLDEQYLSGTGVVGGVETIEPSLEMAETMFLGLRLLDGISMERFKGRFGSDPDEVYGPQIRELEEDGLLEHSDGVLRLTKRGCLLSNQVFIQFL